MVKTNAMRLLAQAKIDYELLEYEVDENNLAGIHVAKQTGLPPEQVFKTLVAKGDKCGYLVFCIPAAKELDLKKAAKAVGDKKIELVHVKELLGLTGYIRGGCSPVGMKKKFPTYFDNTAELFDRVSISAGVRGGQLFTEREKLICYLGAKYADLTVF
ncbi:MAG: Cys-tRNA(Pro) deacylase [Lachnospiraceae bacterium]|nr:Cys-tRNA(Pro) deacylase [Lachnospiraceae bacterium]